MIILDAAKYFRNGYCCFKVGSVAQNESYLVERWAPLQDCVLQLCHYCSLHVCERDFNACGYTQFIGNIVTGKIGHELHLWCHSASLPEGCLALWFSGCGSAVYPLIETGRETQTKAEYDSMSASKYKKERWYITNHKIQPLDLKILFFYHAGKSREREQKSNLPERIRLWYMGRDMSAPKEMFSPN